MKLIESSVTERSGASCSCGSWWVHESRTDWSMLLGSLFLILSGGGRWSVDAVLARSRDGGEGAGS